MAQQRIVIAICAVAGLVAIASAQINPNDCAEKARASIQNYQKAISSASANLAQSLQNQGVNMVDAQKFREQVDSLISEITSMTDVQNGVDPTKLTQAYFKILQSQVTIFRLFMNIDGASALTGEYFKFASKVVDANTNIFLQIGRDCLASGSGSGSRSSPSN